MGCKICKPKMVECLTCERNERPDELFCYDTGKCPVPSAMVRDGKIIGWETDYE